MAVERYESDDNFSTQRLSEPLTFHFSGQTAMNRLFKASMGETLGSWDINNPEISGIPTEEIIELYRRFGEHENGFGIILTGNIQTSSMVPHLQGDLIIDESHSFHGTRFEAFKRMAVAGKAQGSLIIGQLSYAGRQALAGVARKTVIAPSVVPFQTQQLNETFAKTREATVEDIEFLVRAFVHAAKYLEAAGFDGIELHGAHGYVLAQFLSPRTNKRTDAYGGTLENRMRLLVQIAKKIRASTSPSFIVGVKLNSVEFQEGGFEADEAAQVCRVLQDEVGMDFVELSGGTLEKVGHEWTKETTLKREAFFLKFAELIVPQLGATDDERRTKVFITGGLRTAAAMAKALDTVDAVGLARPSAQEPWIARDILQGKVKGAVKPKPPFDNDSVLSNSMAGAQLRQIAGGYRPFNSSDEDAVESFTRDKELHDLAASDDPEKKVSWFPDVSGPKVPYDTRLEAVFRE